MSDITNQTGYTEFPIDGTLDLHIFRPEDVRDLVPDYLDECRSRGILKVNIIHGKGTGVLRSIVHSILSGLPEVVGFSCGGSS